MTVTWDMKERFARMVMARTNSLPRTKHAVLALLSHLNVNKGQRNGQCNPLDRVLAATCGLPVRTLERAIADAKREGLIEKRRHRGASTYTFDWQLIEQDDA